MSVTNESHQPAADPHTRKAYYLGHFRRNREAILAAAGLGLDRPITGCPGWDVAGLTGHMGRVYTFWLKWVSERPRGFSREAMSEIAADRDVRLPGYTAWDQTGFPRDARPDGIVPFARHAGDELDAALVGLEPDEIVWTFIPPRQTGDFVFRRLAMETTIHRWDAEEAHGIAGRIDDALARDGIDEMLMQFREDPAYDVNRDRRHGQTILLREDGGAGRWLVSFDQSGITTAPSAGPADATVAGTASDLWLFIMGRRRPEDMRIDGDQSLAAAWGDLAGRF
ncbi:MAG TPA: maleylpyruvate isomerase family mycothiol-dependent enzyme [Chloroflexota bacterium]|nr:maleylpyruvate isomerase family mycothiol-dependent enzyme [Chloroflexota bacterium]